MKGSSKIFISFYEEHCCYNQIQIRTVLLDSINCDVSLLLAQQTDMSHMAPMTKQVLRTTLLKSLLKLF